MAIGLDDVYQKQKKNVDVNEKNKMIRPWQSLEDSPQKVRTFTAQKAVQKAKSIVERNEMRNQEWRQRHPHLELDKKKNSKEKNTLAELIGVILQ